MVRHSMMCLRGAIDFPDHLKPKLAEWIATKLRTCARCSYATKGGNTCDHKHTDCQEDVFIQQGA